MRAVAELICTAWGPALLCPACGGDLISGRPLVELPPSVITAPGGRGASPDADLTGEVVELAVLLAEVVELAAEGAVFPGRLEHIAERAMEHHWVRRALCVSWAGSSSDRRSGG